MRGKQPATQISHKTMSLYRSLFRPAIIVLLFNCIILPIAVPLLLVFNSFQYIFPRLTRLISRKQMHLEGDKQNEPQCVIISGAASGIGRDLALNYAKKHAFITLGLMVRKIDERATLLKRECEEHSAKVILHACDVTDAKEVEAFVKKMEEQCEIDIVIANAGVSHYTLLHNASSRFKNLEEMDMEIFGINLMGVMNLIVPAVNFMRPRKRGTLVVVSSQASYTPELGSYAAAKSAIADYARSLRMRLAGDGIAVCVVLPGWVATPMADAAADLNKMGMISSTEAATIIMRGIEENQGEIIFPLWINMFARVLQMVPFEWKRGFIKKSVESSLVSDQLTKSQ